MAMVSASYVIGFFQTPKCNIDTLARFGCHSDLFDRRGLNGVIQSDSLGQRGVIYRNSNRAAWSSVGKLRVQAKALSSVPVDQEKLLKYLFRTENGGLVKVAVGKKSVRYSVHIEVLPADSDNIQEKVILRWGIYRSDSSSFIPLEFESSAPEGQNAISETPVVQNISGSYVVKMEFESYLAPFYLSFVLRHPSGADKGSLELKSHRNTNFCVPVGMSSGDPAPLGLSIFSDGKVNFALFSRNVESISLCLFDDYAAEKPALEIELDPYVNRTGDIWHACIDSVGPFVNYGYRCRRATTDGTERVLLDPYSKLIRKRVPGLPDLGELRDAPGFDWNGDVRPGLPMEKLVIYRLNVKQFTADKSSNLSADISGTFTGVAEKIEHLKSLGFNGVLLEPIFSHSESHGPYFPFHYFSPMQVYGPAGDSTSAINSMKQMIKKMHASGIEVLLEVVFSHTSDDGTIYEVDPLSYFHSNGDSDFGVQFALNCNYPIVQRLIIDSLRYWVTEFRVDGFCFINASCLLRGFHGESLSRPPLIEAISYDPVLSRTKLIADCWDPYDLTFKEVCFPHWKKWAEINSKFSEDVRNYLRGEGLISGLATRLCGSGDIFSLGRTPSFSFNFIARNFGFPLVDLVSFSGSDLDSELSWNCGEEGATDNKIVLERRLKQIRNFLFILFISLGVPVLNMGDECGLSAGGSPAYGDRNPFNWKALSTVFGVQTKQFISYLSSLRERRSDLLQKREFLKEEAIGWYHSDLSLPKWDDPSVKFLAVELTPEIKDNEQSLDSSCIGGNFYAAFNAGDVAEDMILPSPPEGTVWLRLVDTALPYPGFFLSDGVPIPEKTPGSVSYEVQSYSCVLFEAEVQLT